METTTTTYQTLRIETHEVNGVPYARIWRGKATRPYANYRFKNEEHRARYLAEQRAAEDQRLEAKARRAEEKRQERETFDARAAIQPGAIVVNTWGYDQTNTDFYVVESVTRCFVMLRRICAAGHVETGFMQGRSRAHVCEPHGTGYGNHARVSKHKVSRGWRNDPADPSIHFEHGAGSVTSPDREHWSSSYA